MSISAWPEGERPRERLLRHGAAVLSDAELLAIYLRVGVRGKSAVDLARDLLARYDNRLSRLATSTPGELSQTPGIGPAKAAQLQASFELARRALQEGLGEQPEILSSPGAVRDWLRLSLGWQQREIFAALWLDAQHRLIAHETLFAGSLTQSCVHPREVVKSALAHNAAAVVFAHNHPSGVCEPSPEDIRLTHHLKEALALVEVRLLDHFIVSGKSQPVSLAERGEV
jgi:DNA repair protein RadC